MIYDLTEDGPSKMKNNMAVNSTKSPIMEEKPLDISTFIKNE